MHWLTLTCMACAVVLAMHASIATANDDAMFEFARSQLDSTSVVVRRGRRTRVRPSGKRPKITSTGPNNYYLSAQMQVGKAMAIAKGIRRSYNDMIIKKTALLAAQAKLIPEALSAVGVGVYNDYQRYENCVKKGKSASTCKQIAKRTGIIEQLRKVLGNDKFNDLISVDGDVSLVFAIDTTGSMREEINQAKAIITQIATYQREGHVDYILSPFNDPGTGPVFGKDADRNKFLQKVRNLRATGGGDCKEKTFHGIIDAISKGNPRIGSPMYVFTDAGPKDENFNDEYNKDNAIGLALDYMMPVNFFFSRNPGSRCAQPQTFESFKTMIEETEGVGIFFGSTSTMGLMGEVVKASLDGMTTIKSGGSSSRRRGSRPGGLPGLAPSKRYVIPVDNSVSKLIVVATSQTNPHMMQLTNPRGVAVIRSHLLALGAIWIINRPLRGAWSLVVPAACGSHSFKVTSSSPVNIDFDHYFVWSLPRQPNVEFPIAHPLLNKLATAKLLIPLKDRLNRLSLDIVRADDGTVIKQASLSGITAKFTPPSVPFKLRLKGRTASGFPFERTSRRVIRASTMLLRMVYSRNYITLPRGRTSTVRFAFHNVGPSNRFKFSLTTGVLGVRIVNPTLAYTVSSGRVRYFSARITLSTRVPLLPVLVTAKYASTDKTATKLRVSYLAK